MRTKNKIIPIILSLLMIFSAFNIQVFAQENKTDDKLTYEKAVKMALENSYELKKAEYNKKISDINTGNALENLGGSLNNPQILAAEKLKTGDKISSERTEKTKRYIEEATKMKVKSLFSNIDTIKRDIEISQMKLENNNAKLNSAQLKYDLGLESHTNLTTKQLDLKTLKQDNEKMKKELNDYYIDLKKTIGYDDKKKLEIEPIQFKFEALKDNADDLDLRVKRALSSDLNLWGLKQESNMAELDIELYALNVIDGVPSNMQPSREDYRVLGYKQILASNSVEEAKENVASSVIKKYNSIKKLELDYESAKIKRKLLEEKLKVSEASLKAGLMIKQDYDDLLLSKKELDNSIQKIEAGHAIMKESYENPILSSGAAN